MRTSPVSGPAESEAFAATHWSVVAAAGRSEVDPEIARAALAQLCQTYWPPLYAYVRSRGYSMHDAQDLTQGFFAYLVERKIYTRTDRQKGKFRSFLLASLTNFLADARDRTQALKRGGGHDFVPLEEGRLEDAEAVFKTHDAAPNNSLPSDHLFERAWAETLVATVLEQLETTLKAEGKQKMFESFRAFVTAGADPLPNYAELAVRMGTTESTLRSHVTRLRARYREMLRSEVRRTVDTEAEVDEELRELLRILSSR